MVIWLGRVAISLGMQSRLPKEERSAEDRPWMGFAYGAWWPRAYRRGAASGFAYWLCFHAAIDVWPKSARVRGFKVTR